MKTKITRKRTEIITLKIEVDMPEGVNTYEEILALVNAVKLPTQVAARLECILTGATGTEMRVADHIVNGKATVTLTWEKDLPIPGDGEITTRRIG